MIIRKSFKLTFNNAELWSGDFDGFDECYDLFQKKFLEDIDVIKRPSSPSLILLNLYGTTVTYELGSFIIDNLISVQANLQKVAFSGLNSKSKKNVKKYFKNVNSDLQFSYSYFDDLQKAKEWLA